MRIRPSIRALRVCALVAGLFVVFQSALGTILDFYVTIPPGHAGSRPSNFFVGSFDSVVWSITHGALILVIHALLGLFLVVFAVLVAIMAVALRRAATASLAVFAALLVIAAGFNGASFLDFGLSVNALLMAFFALGSLSCYFLIVYLLPGHAPNGRSTESI